MAMNEWLAGMYGTGGAAAPAPVAPDQMDKTAQLELFAKLAADEGINLADLPAETVNQLFEETFGKTAEFPPGLAGKKDKDDKDGDDEDKKKEEAAKKEHDDKKEAAAKFAEADLMGRTMAHAFVHELGQIEAGRGEKTATDKTAAMPAALAKGLAAARAGAGKAAEGAKDVGKKLHEAAEKHPAAAAGAAGAAAGAAAGRASKSEKKASALDELALENAVKVAAAAGWDPDECAGLLQKALEAGEFEGGGEKVAYVDAFADAVHVRSLEMLEKCKYPINWDEVFPR